MNSFIPIVNRHHRIAKSRRALVKVDRLRKIKNCLKLLALIAVLVVLWAVVR